MEAESLECEHRVVWLNHHITKTALKEEVRKRTREGSGMKETIKTNVIVSMLVAVVDHTRLGKTEYV